MTRPKWIRKRDKVINRISDMGKFAMQQGYISLKSDSGKRIVINFVNEDKELDVEKFSKYFGTLIGTVKSVYREAAKDPKRKSSKYFINGEVDNLVGNIMVIVHNKWGDYGHEIDL